MTSEKSWLGQLASSMEKVTSVHFRSLAPENYEVRDAQDPHMPAV
jgi:hypothetical protein